jgi:hypothetical protein
MAISINSTNINHTMMTSRRPNRNNKLLHAMVKSLVEAEIDTTVIHDAATLPLLLK